MKTRQIASRTISDSTSFNWNSPDTSLLHTTVEDRAAFPTGMLGGALAHWVEAVAQSRNVPVDYVGASLITLAAGLIGNARTTDAIGWTEPSVLWTVLVGNPSAGKSPAMDPFVEMVADFEAEAADELEEDEQSNWAIHIDDVTAQAAAEVASDSPKGLILMKDELSHWWSRFGQSGGEAFWLKAFGARPEMVKRKGRPALHIKRLAISVLGGAQPNTLTQFACSKENKGFAARWLYVFPKPVKGFRIAKSVSMDPGRTVLRRLWKLGLVDGKPLAVPVSPRAIARFEQWVGLKRQAAEADEDGVWGQWLGKQGGVALRLALVLEHLWWAADATPGDITGPTKISGSAMTAAMKFIDTYASPMAALALKNAAQPVEDQDASRLLRLLSNKGDAQFNARLLGRGSHGPAGRLSQPSAMAAACEVLAAAKLIRHVGERADGKAGRRPSVYEVNPILFDADVRKAARRRAHA